MLVLLEGKMSAKVTDKMKERFQKGLRKYKPIITKAIASDLNESDTVTIITDILESIFGYDKYSEITSEYAIKKTFCDLAIKINDSVKILIEVKSIGTTLNRDHLRQATNYGANSGIEWVILTNGHYWRVYNISFGNRVDYNLVFEFDFTELSMRNTNDIEHLALLSKENVGKSGDSLKDFYQQKKVLDKVVVGQILQTETVTKAIKSVMKKLVKETKVSDDEIVDILVNGVIKREVLDDDKVDDVKKQLKKALK